MSLSRIALNRMAKNCALALLRAYQWAISPLLPPSCRYVPTCSEYAAEAIELHGVLKGSALAGWRLLRCHPFAKGGLDPVPMPGDVRADGPQDSSAAKMFCGALLRRAGLEGRPHTVQNRTHTVNRAHTIHCSHIH